MNTIVKIDPKEFGLEEKKAEQIAAQFKPMLDKMQELEAEFNQVAAMEMSEQKVKAAKELRLKYVKVRTGTADIHKEQKAFYLAGGRFVDGWKNAQLFASQGIEEKLSEIESYYARIEAERIQNLRAERWGMLQAYVETEPVGLGVMDETVFGHMLSGAKAAHEAKIEAEKKAEAERLEYERVEKLARERTELALPYLDFWSEYEKTLNFGKVSQADFDAFMERNKKFKAERAANLEKQRKEYERLKAEAIEREKQEQERIEIARQEYLMQLEKERQEREKHEAELRAEKERAEKAQRELQEIKAAEEKDRKRIEAEAKKAAKEPSQKRLKMWIESAELPTLNTDNFTPEAIECRDEIQAKFQAFKTWALNVIENK
jgi:chemosensory pili system protein ChpA (sensor histidine kinase/response regulator)